MPSDNLDDLFRQHLGGHATPPGADLQRRLAELAEAERLDSLFRTGLEGHASQPRRAVWERLEDEHLHPTGSRRRRGVAWWQLSAAAVLLLTLLAGGLLWQGGRGARPGSGLATGRAATQQPAGTKAGSAQLSATDAETAATRANDFASPYTPAKEAIARISPNTLERNKKSLASQATAPGNSPSSTPIATTTRASRAATATQAASSHRLPHRPLDAATGQLASSGGRQSPADQPTPATTTVAPATTPAPSPALVAATMTNPSEVVEVEVRRGPAPTQPAVVLASASATEPAASPRRRLRLGGLLRQADHLVHGEPVSLAEATGLAQTVTVQARLGGRTLSRTIQL
jgi:hypothetical protein